MLLLQELRDRRVKAIEDARAIYAQADKEKREATPEEVTRFDKFMAEADSLKADIDRRERLATEEKALAETTGRPTPNPVGTTTVDYAVRARQRDLALRAWAKAPIEGQTDQLGRLVQISDEERAAAQAVGVRLDRNTLNYRLFDNAPRSQREIEERAALGIGSAGIGLNTVPDEGMRALETALLAFGGMRQVASVIRTATGAALPIPTSNDTGNVGARLAENTQVAQVEMTFSQITLDSYKYSSKLVLAAVEFLQDTSINAEAWLGERLGERIARIVNTELTTGTGSSQPNGIVTAATSGLTAASATAVTADELLDLIHSVDPAYRVGPGVSFMFNDSTLKFLRKLKDGEGRYIWQPGLNGAPDSLFGYRYVVNQAMASIATTNKAVLFGDCSKYLIRDVLDVQVIRLVERYADFHQVGFLAFSRHDGDLVNAGTNPVKVITQP